MDTALKPEAATATASADAKITNTKQDVARKKTKILESPVAINSRSISYLYDAEYITGALKNFKPGKDVRALPVFLKVEGKKYFSKPEPEKLWTKIGNDILRVASCGLPSENPFETEEDSIGRFAVKDVRLVKNTSVSMISGSGAGRVIETKPKLTEDFLVKWDKDFQHLNPRTTKKEGLDRTERIVSERIFVDLPEDSRLQLKQDFLERCCYLAGCTAVAGDLDYNPDNVAAERILSNKNVIAIKPIKIDNHPFLNYFYPKYQVIGSYFSNDILRILIGEEDPILGSCISTMSILQMYQAVASSKKISNKTDDFKESYAALVCDSYQQGIDWVLRERIEQNINKNPQIEEFFKQYIEGVLAMIAIAEDENFLKNLKDKYEQIQPPRGSITAKQTIEAFKKNAKDAEKSHAFFLELYEDLQIKNKKLEEKDRKYKIAPEARISILQEELGRNNNLLMQIESYIKLQNDISSNNPNLKNALDAFNKSKEPLRKTEKDIKETKEAKERLPKSQQSDLDTKLQELEILKELQINDLLENEQTYQEEFVMLKAETKKAIEAYSDLFGYFASFDSITTYFEQEKSYFTERNAKIEAELSKYQDLDQAEAAAKAAPGRPYAAGSNDEPPAPKTEEVAKPAEASKATIPSPAIEAEAIANLQQEAKGPEQRAQQQQG